MPRNRAPPRSTVGIVAVAILAFSVLAPVAVASGPAVLTGTVTDAGSGEPLPRIEIRVENRRAEAFNWTYTGSDGAYRIEVPAGNLLVGFHPNQTIPPSCQDTPHEMGSRLHNCDTVVYEHAYAPEVRSIHVGQGQRTVHVQLERLEQSGSGIRGWTVDSETGEPIEHAVVILHDLEPDRWARTTTDSNGAWAFQLETGPVTVRTIAEDYRVAASTETVRSPPTETVIPLSPGEALRDPVEHGFTREPPDNDSRWVDLAASTDEMGPPPIVTGQRTQGAPWLGTATVVGVLALSGLGVRRLPGEG